MTISDSVHARGDMLLGDEGDDVRAVQLALAKLGYLLKGTGYFGGATDAAVSAFQRHHGLEVDGEVGPDTARVLDTAKRARDTTVTPPALALVVARPLWVQAAVGWLGTKEQPGSGDNPVILKWAKGMGGEISAEYTHDSIPWCALFANQCLVQVNLKGTGTLWALDFAKWGSRLAGPAVGAFAPMTRNGGGHITIVVGRDKNGNIMCIGGNQSDAVTIAPFDPARVVSWRWPVGATLPSKVGMASLPLVSSRGLVLSTNEA